MKCDCGNALDVTTIRPARKLDGTKVWKYLHGRCNAGHYMSFSSKKLIQFYSERY